MKAWPRSLDRYREVFVLASILRRRLSEDDALNGDVNKVMYLLERSITMEVINAAFEELSTDTDHLLDPDQLGYAASAVALCLDRDEFGAFSISVKLNQIAGGQLTYVLSVARKHELDVREDGGWLRLSPHFIEAESDSAKVEDAAAV